MAGEEERWEYNHVSWISEGTTGQDVSNQANASMKQWSDAGWELFSTQSTPYVLMSGGGGRGTGIVNAIGGSKSRCMVYNVMIWRRRIRPGVTEIGPVGGGGAPPPERESGLGWEPPPERPDFGWEPFGPD